MKDERKTKAQLIEELNRLRERVAALAADRIVPRDVDRDRLLSGLVNVSKAVLEPYGPEEALTVLAREIVETGLLRSLMVAIVDHRAGEVRVIQSLAHDADGAFETLNEKATGLKYDLDDFNITAEVARTGEMAVIEEFDERFDNSVDTPATRKDKASIFIPLVYQDRVLAVLATGCALEDKKAVLWRIEAIRPLMDQVAVALDHALLRNELQMQVELQMKELNRTVGQLTEESAERREAEKALRESERLHRGAIEATGAVPYYRNYETGVFDSMGKGIQALTGYSADEVTSEVLGRLFVEELPSGPMRGLTVEDASALFRRDQEALWCCENRMITDTGEEKWVSDSSKGVYDDNGRLVGSLGILQDITERKRLEKELRRTHNLESLGTLAGGIAHDFNNVLTGVTGNLALLSRMLDKDSEEYEIAAEARQSADRTRDLTRQLIAFAKGGAPIKEVASIEEVVRQTTGLALSGANTKPHYLFADNLPPVDIDTGQICQVIQNLVLNADQAMPDGGALTISAENIEVPKGDPMPLAAGRYVKVTVADQGIGMSEDVLGRIFDPYYTTKEMGHGLGLSISHTIISNHGGHITVSSEQNVGTTFDIYLLASEEQPVETTVQQAEPARGSGKILLMDDEETIHRTVGRILGDLGYKVSLASDGDQALRAYKAALDSGKSYDLVIVDLTIPGGMGGKEAVGKLHEIDPKARVLVSSGYASDPVMADPKAYGFVGAIKKPVDLDELAGTVHGLLSNENQ